MSLSADAIQLNSKKAHIPKSINILRPFSEKKNQQDLYMSLQYVHYFKNKYSFDPQHIPFFILKKTGWNPLLKASPASPKKDGCHENF